MSVVRAHYFVDDVAILSPKRRDRPRGGSSNVCPFCRGNEYLTPPATLVARRSERGYAWDSEEGDVRYSDWAVRCFPNIYPIFDTSRLTLHNRPSRFVEYKAYGFHEVLVETPVHDRSPHEIELEELVLVIDACLHRCVAYSHDPFIKQILICKNHGEGAGASIKHPHLHLFALPFKSRRVMLELEAFNGDCPICKVLKLEERDGERVIFSNESFVVICPWNSRYPYEVWIIPRRHSPTFMEIRSYEKGGLAEALRKTLNAINQLEEGISYNYAYILPPIGETKYHWRIEIYPRLTTHGGLELATGIMVNVVSPEEAAASLRRYMI